MPARIPLPPHLADGAFHVRDALVEGLSRDRLRGTDLFRPFSGIRSLHHLDPEPAYAPLLRDGERFSHVSAARMWGVPLPVPDPMVHVTFAGARARSRGVVGHESRAGTTVVRRGLPVSDPATTYLELAALWSRDALTAAGDHLVLEPRVLDPRDARPHVSLERLRRAVEGATGRGVRRARDALGSVRVGAESIMETRLRLLAVRSGLPEPVLQHEVRDRLGRVGWFDLAWPERRLIAEYDGDQHRTDRAQYERDMRRIDRAIDAGWRVVRVRARGILIDPSDTRRRLLAGWDGSG